MKGELPKERKPIELAPPSALLNKEPQAASEEKESQQVLEKGSEPDLKKKSKPTLLPEKKPEPVPGMKMDSEFVPQKKLEPVPVKKMEPEPEPEKKQDASEEVEPAEIEETKDDDENIPEWRKRRVCVWACVCVCLDGSRSSFLSYPKLLRCFKFPPVFEFMARKLICVCVCTCVCVHM